MKSETGHLTGQKGIKLFYRSWEPDTTEKVLCIIHGHGEHSGRYEHIAAHLSKENISTWAMDLRGHGRSEGKRGHSPSYQILLDDIAELLKTARQKFVDQPIYLMGHSMGGNLVANYMIDDKSKEITGYILSAPWFKLAFEPPAIKLKLGKIMAGVWPSFSEHNGLNVNHISRDDLEVEKYRKDPLIHGMISAAMFKGITEAGERAINKNSDIHHLGLIYHGTDDQIISYETTRQFAENCPSAEWKSLDGYYHEPHNDLNRETVLKLLGDWIKKN